MSKIQNYVKFMEPKGTAVTIDLISEYINKHQKLASSRYEILKDAYLNDYKIYTMKEKEPWKPDNRISVNFAKYITDTMNGFFMGIPVKTISSDEKVNEYIKTLESYNNQEDQNSELSKICDIYGHGYEIYYIDDFGKMAISFFSPLEGFMIYDDDINSSAICFVRYYKDSEDNIVGDVYTNNYKISFTSEGGYRFLDKGSIHGFSTIPVNEFLENEERQGIFENVLPMIDAYNKALSEKANDVDYFADAYMKVLGAELDEKSIKHIRSNRVINFEGDSSDLTVEFMQKPSGDTTQENLINRLERLIYQISMVANISDENFGTSSGIALKYKLLAMSNLAKTKERKFIAGMNRRYNIIFSNVSVTGLPKDAELTLSYEFHFNYPANLESEATVAGQLSGITSKETQLKVLSIVDNVDDEIKKMEEENDSISYNTDYPTNRTLEETDELLAE